MGSPVRRASTRPGPERVVLPSGPHRRHDPLTDEWVLVSAGRTQRPWQGRTEGQVDADPPRSDPTCYLCPGNRRANGERNPDYDATFVFTNDFAALSPDTPDARLESGLLRAEAERGTCRVVCFSPRHDLTLSAMSPAAVRAVVDLWADQTSELGATWRWVQIFENRGEAMGASNPHPHGQIWAGTALPVRGAREDAAQRRHRAQTGQSLLGDVVDQESAGERVVEEGDEWLVIVPFWAVWPFETLLVPRRPAARIDRLDASQRDGLVSVMQRLMRRYDGLFGHPLPFSMGWHQAPFDDGADEHWQLHAHFLPPTLEPERRKFMVGYELLSEPQRDITPEDAAEQLRAVRLVEGRAAAAAGAAAGAGGG
jgi:UDPglucose--hexose-1-phosphate uridylyltransferase